MIKNPSILNIVIPYSNALYEFCITNNCLHIITNDFQKLGIYLKKYNVILNLLKSPLLEKKIKKQLLKIILNSYISIDSFNFLNFLVDCNRINLILEIIQEYLNLVYNLLRFKTIEVNTALDFTDKQKRKLIKFLKKLTKTNELIVFIIIDPNIIGGFYIKVDSIIYDYTIQKQFNLFTNYLTYSNI